MGDVRVGTRERELAMGALDEHRRAGRLDAGEYHDRSATAAGARMRSELDGLFADLPPPHPVYPGDGWAAPRRAADRPDPAGSVEPAASRDGGDRDGSDGGVRGGREGGDRGGHEGGDRGGHDEGDDAVAGPSDLPELVAPLGATLGRHAGVLSALAPVAVFALVAVTGFRFPWLFLLVPVILVVLGWLGHRHGPH